MGNACRCDVRDQTSEYMSFEFASQPFQTTIIGACNLEEPFIATNLSLHKSIFLSKHKAKVRSKSSNSRSSHKHLESYHISLNRSIQSNSKTEDETGNILLEGPLLKYRPGLSQDYTERWCRLTIDGFAYYKTQWAATCSNKTPLAFIPMIQIKSAKIVKRSGKGFEKFSEFEIFLYKEEELTKMSRNTNGFTLRPNEPLQTSVPKSWWSVRQVEWYSAERRLLFASLDPGVIKKWVDLIDSMIIQFCNLNN